MKRGFTLVEMLIVMAVIAILTATLVSSFNSAQKKSRIVKATSDCGEMTKAILSYGNYVDSGIPTCTDAPAGESTLSFILGGGTDRAGNRIPILYNAALSPEGEILDPWGMPYRVTVRPVDVSVSDSVGKNLKTGIYLPNRYGRRAMAAETPAPAQ